MNYDTMLGNIPSTEALLQPCFAFSAHKCGSSLFFGMLEMVCAEAGIPGVSIPDLMFLNGVLDPQWFEDPALMPFFRKNLLYYGFRELPPVLSLDPTILARRPFVLLVRDPRDALVSKYFSFGRKKASHVQPRENSEAFREIVDNLPEMKIDDYVRVQASNLKDNLETYRRSLYYGYGLVRRYEEVYYDKLGFLREVFAHFGIAVADDILVRAAEAFDIRPEEEDETKHIRQGLPGDHARKLKAETIADLTDEFREIGNFYGYRF
jgi:hypothetical protein